MLFPALVLLLLPHASAADGTDVDARFALALYCNPTCDDSVLDGLEKDLAAIPAVEGFDEVALAPGRLMGLADTTASPYGTENGFAVPDADFVAAYGIDVDRPEQLATSESVVLAWFAGPRSRAVETLKAAHIAFSNAAQASNGWVEDLDTQNVYGQAAWAARDPNVGRPASPEGGQLTDWFIIENSPGNRASSEPSSTDLRLVTRGLRRFGDRELVLEHVAPDDAGDAAFVINAVALALHDRSGLAGTLTLDNAEVRGTATLAETRVQDGDPEAPLIAVQFKGQVLAEMGAPALSASATPAVEPPAVEPPAVGPPLAIPAPAVPPELPAPALALVPPEAGPPKPAVVPTTLVEAQAAARARLDGVVRPAFVAGLPAGERLAVSVPFPNPDGTREYLWVDVQRWQGSILRGIVATEPSRTRSVRKGQEVTIDQAQVFDYVWKRADGSREGNGTAAFVN